MGFKVVAPDWYACMHRVLPRALQTNLHTNGRNVKISINGYWILAYGLQIQVRVC
jgi:hypothetical protein